MMKKKLSLLLVVLLLSNSIVQNVHSVTRAKVKVGSAIIGTAVGWTVASSALLLEYVIGSLLYSSENNSFIKPICIGTGVGAGFLTYYLTYKIFERYTSEYQLEEIGKQIDAFKQEDFLSKEFKDDDEMLAYLNAKYGSFFVEQESLGYLKELDFKLNEIMQNLEEIDEIQDPEFLREYKDLNEQIYLLSQFINSKIVLIIFYFVEADLLVLNSFESVEDLTVQISKKTDLLDLDSILNMACDRLNEHLSSLRVAREIITNLLAKIPHLSKFNDLYQSLKEQESKLKFLEAVVQIKSIQVSVLSIEKDFNLIKDGTAVTIESDLRNLLESLERIEFEYKSLFVQISDSKILQDMYAMLNNKILSLKVIFKIRIVEAIINVIEMDDLVDIEFNLEDEFIYALAAKFESVWYLMLAKRGLVTYQDKLYYANRLLAELFAINSDFRENEDYLKLQEKVDSLSKKLACLILTIVKNKDYQDQLQSYGKYQDNQKEREREKQFRKEQLEHEKELDEKHRTHEEKLFEKKLKFKKEQVRKQKVFEETLFQKQESFEKQLLDAQQELDKKLEECKLNLGKICRGYDFLNK